MGDDLFSMVEKFEILLFFSGYTILFCFVNYLWTRPNIFLDKLKALIPFGYAFSATLFLGYFLNKIYLNHILGNVNIHWYHPFLIIWGALALLFWVPFFKRKPALSLMHSLVFFYFILKDLVSYVFGNSDQLVIRNNMNILSTSFLINVATLTLVYILFYLLHKLKKD